MKASAPSDQRTLVGDLELGPVIGSAATDDTIAAPTPPAVPQPPTDPPSVDTLSRTRFSAGSAPNASTENRRARPIAATGQVGRHHILGVLGKGGMGAVYDAYDPELDRRLAIKLLLAGPSRAATQDQDAQRELLLAEAQAMARVSHPNVVQVYDVGTHDDQVYVAMERLEGGTLGDWVQQRPRSWREIVSKYVQAGRGLAAAHATGLIHLDFKPDNVLLDREGRPRVLDFGIAQLFDPGQRADEVELEGVGSRNNSRLATAGSGRIAGTPAYMAPEQFSGQVTDARTDQFAFCIALYESLAKTRPFSGASVVEIATAVLRDEARALPGSTKAPRYVARVLQRGLAKQPAHRYPSMDALLAELDRDPHRTRKRVAMVASLAAVAGLTAGISTWHTQTSALCSGASEQLEGIWDPARAAEITSSIEATKLPHASDTAARVEATLNRYAQTWTTSYTQNCEATTMRAEQSEAAMDLRLACLQRAKFALQATTELLADADAALVDAAQPLVDELPDLQRCDDLEALRTQTPEPAPNQREAVAEIRRVIARASASLGAGRYEAAFGLATQAHEQATALDYGPLLTEASLVLGLAERRQSHHERALELGERTISLATKWSQWELAHEATALAMLTLGSSMARADEAMRYAPWLEGLSEQLDTSDAHERELASVAAVFRSKGDYAAAEPLYRQALALAEQAHGADSVAAAANLVNLGANLRKAGQYDEAIAVYRRGANIYADKYGPLHPRVVTTRWALAEILVQQAHYEEARVEHEWVLQRWRAVHGDRGADIMRSHIGLSGVYLRLQDYDAAEGQARAAIAASDEAAGTQVLLPTAYNNLGNALEYLGDLDGAIEAQRAALELQLQRHGEAHPSVAATRSAVGLLLSRSGNGAEAEVEQRAALAVLEDKLGPEHPTTANVRSNLGLALEQLGRLDEALEQQRSALAVSLAQLGAEHPQTQEIVGIIERLETQLGRP